MEEQNRQKPKIQPLNPSSKQPEGGASPEPKHKAPRFLVRLTATLVVLAVAVCTVLGIVIGRRWLSATA